MRLTVLGGSAAGTNTGQGCSGYLVQSTAANVVLDLGPGTLQELRKHVNFRTLTAIVISHMHVDHMADLLALRFALAYNPVASPGPVPLFLPPGGRSTLDNLAAVFSRGPDAKEFFSSVFTITEYEPSETLAIADTCLTFFTTAHYVPCWAIRLSAPVANAGDLTYTADTGPAADIAKFATGSSVLVAEATLRETPSAVDAARGHLSAAEAGQLATSAKAATLVLTHLWEELGFETYRDRAAATFAGRLELARPGLHIEW
ncbi:MAG: MBL fold metallo-hydrolase [Chloroflexota bacterium]|nr:MBL fold metallo-hydrolase [Chloroflexota bacterium]